MTKMLVALVGTKHRGREAINLLAALPQGEPLTLIREPDNRFDPNCVQVWARGVHLGFVKATQVRPIAHRLDAAIERANLPAKAVTMAGKLAIDGGKQPMVEIED